MIVYESASPVPPALHLIRRLRANLGAVEIDPVADDVAVTRGRPRDRDARAVRRRHLDRAHSLVEPHARTCGKTRLTPQHKRATNATSVATDGRRRISMLYLSPATPLDPAPQWGVLLFVACYAAALVPRSGHYIRGHRLRPPWALGSTSRARAGQRASLVATRPENAMRRI